MSVKDKVFSWLGFSEQPHENSGTKFQGFPQAAAEAKPAPVEEQHVEPPAPRVVFPPGHCPQCGAGRDRIYPVSGIQRCQQCGWQSESQGAIGVSRKDFLDGNFDARKIRINSGDFNQALARMKGQRWR